MSKREKIVLVGGGGHCKSVIDVIETQGLFEIAGIVDRRELIGQSVLGYPILADDLELPFLVSQYKNFLVTVGHIKSNKTRIRLFQQIKNLGGTLPSIRSPKAYVSRYSQIGEGTIVMHFAVVNANARIGCNTIINTGAVIEHDAEIQNHCHVSTGAYINGGCKIESSVFIGSRAVLNQNIEVGFGSLIGAGAVVVSSVGPNSFYAGVPARFINFLENE